MIAQQLLTVEEFLACAAGGHVVTPDAKITELLRANNLPVRPIAPFKADAIARLGFEKIQSGEVTSPEALDANYVRRSDAEIKKTVNS